MSAKDTVRSNKTAIIEILSADRTLILNKVFEKCLITYREYNNLKCINKANAEEHVIGLVDNIMNKGEDTCQSFLDLLQTDEEIKLTFPELRNLQLDNRCLFTAPLQADTGGISTYIYIQKLCWLGQCVDRLSLYFISF